MRVDSRTVRAVLTLTILAGLGLAQAGRADGYRMEEIALAWVEAHNSGDLETMATFRAAHREDTDDSWRQQFPGLVRQLGQLEPTDVMIRGSNELVLGCDSDQGPLRFTFTFNPDDRERIQSIDVERAGEERENPLPPLELPDGDWEARRAAIDAWLRSLAEEDLFSGAVLVGQDGEVRFEGAYGLANREFEAPNTVETRFDIGSITKDFTRVAIAQLLAEGKLGLDDTLGQHLPDYPNAEARETVTIGQLFVHASGIGDYFTEEWGQTPMGALRTHQDYIDIWGEKPLLFEPGTDRRYSNFGFTLLGAIVETVSGQDYFDYVQEHVLTPAGMTGSGFFPTDEPVPNVAVGYTYYERGGERGDTLRKNIYLEPVVGGPWGKTYSTARDLWNFWQALSHHQLTPDAYTRWVLLSGPPPESPDAEGDPAPVMEIGLGGGGAGIAAEIVAEDGLVLIVLANIDPPVTVLVAERLMQAMDQG